MKGDAERAPAESDVQQKSLTGPGDGRIQSEPPTAPVLPSNAPPDAKETPAARDAARRAALGKYRDIQGAPAAGAR